MFRRGVKPGQWRLFQRADKPRLLSDNGSSYISGDLADWLDDRSMEHVRGAPYHPQTQGKIERWHQTLKNRILLENYYLAGDLEAQIDAFVAHYNHRRYHESLRNLTPADVYFGRGQITFHFSMNSNLNSTPRKCLGYRTPIEAFALNLGVALET